MSEVPKVARETKEPRGVLGDDGHEKAPVLAGALRLPGDDW